jgi:pyrimidine and pyridine-specific 5'-nucleotidase
MSKSVSEVSLNFPTTPTKDAPEADAESDGIANGAASGDASPAEGSGGSATRIAPNLSLPPKVVSVLETPDVAVGCVDPTKRRIVASTRFSSRAGAERRIYASSLPFDHGKTATQLEAKAGADMSVNQDGEALKTASTSNEPQSSSDGDSPSTHAAGLVAPIRGAWEAQAGALATPARNPMAMELDHESVVVGCADGLIYRIHFVGSEYGPETLLDAAASSDGASGSGAGGAPGVGDATITDLLQLRDLWREIMVPAAEPDHPGRLRVDRLKAMGLK